MIRILVLGHTGMLGNTVVRYFSALPGQYRVDTINDRWDTDAFKHKVKNAGANFIINCIGAIPQKHAKEPSLYQKLNIDLPIFLESIGIPVIHPSTDCEFSGQLPIGERYRKEDLRDAEDAYGKSKAMISEMIERKFMNTKIMRVSIIGHETSGTSVSLLEWVLASSGSVKGYTDHYWNGMTTLEWSKQCARLIDHWGSMPVLNQYGTKQVENKYELVQLIAEVYRHDLIVEPYDTKQNVNKCLESDIEIPSIRTQLEELRRFYKR